MELKVVQFNPAKHKKATLTDLERAWLENYFLTGNATEAARMLGLKNPAQRGWEYRRRLSHFIEANLKEMIGRAAPAALETIYEIATTCPDPKTRLAAAQDLLNRAGFKEATKVEMSLKDKSDEEIEHELKVLMKKAGIIDAEVVDDS